MELKTSSSQSLELAENKAQYDAYVKNILANKVFLAWILKYTTKEFKDLDIDEIIQCIEDPMVSCIPLALGQSNVKPKITGISTEDAVPNEGTVKFDIRFTAYTPNKESIKLIINVEAQKKFSPGYDLVTRGVFYGARMLSAQLDTEFTTTNYDNIKKVYSIWICMNAPSDAKHTITSFHMTKTGLVGNFAHKARYDLMEIVFVCLGDEKEGSDRSPLIEMLNTLMSPSLTASKKEEILEEKFDIESKETIREELRQMCNLSDLVEEEATARGLAKGMAQGMAQGEAQTLVGLVDAYIERNNVSLDTALEVFGISSEKYNDSKALLQSEK